MKPSFLASMIGILAACLVLGCTSTPEPIGGAYSGYLGDYSSLKDDKTESGQPIKRYVSPRFTPDRYRAVLLEDVVFYPEPKPSDQVNQQSLDAIRSHMDKALQREFSKRFAVVKQPGPGVVRVNVALTAVGSQTEGLKPYQYVPIALVITTAKAAVSGRPEEAVINIESKGTDSVTNERLYAAVRSGRGERLKQEGDKGQKVTAADLQALIDKWAEAAANEAMHYVQPSGQRRW